MLVTAAEEMIPLSSKLREQRMPAMVQRRRSTLRRRRRSASCLESSCRRSSSSSWLSEDEGSSFSVLLLSLAGSEVMAFVAFNVAISTTH